MTGHLPHSTEPGFDPIRLDLPTLQAMTGPRHQDMLLAALVLNKTEDGLRDLFQGESWSLSGTAKKLNAARDYYATLAWFLAEAADRCLYIAPTTESGGAGS